MNRTLTGFQVIDLSEYATKSVATLAVGLYDKVKKLLESEKSYIVKTTMGAYILSNADIHVLSNAVEIYFPISYNLDIHGNPVGTYRYVFAISSADTYTFKATGYTGGTTDYADLSNKPGINGVTLTAGKTGADLDLLNALFMGELSIDYSTLTTTTTFFNIFFNEAMDAKIRAMADDTAFIRCFADITAYDGSQGQTSSDAVKICTASVLVKVEKHPNFIDVTGIVEGAAVIAGTTEGLTYDISIVANPETTSDAVNFGIKKNS